MSARKPPERSRVAASEGATPLGQQLDELCAALHKRAPDDLSAISLATLPEEIRPLADCLNRLMQRLENGRQAQTHFISNAAHRLRDPLTGLKMQAELALTEDSPENLHILLTQLAASADGIARLVHQLLALARIEAGDTAGACLETLDIEALARKAVTAHAPAAQARHIDLGFEGTNSAVCIHGQGALLRELLDNLLDNALRHGAPNGRVTVRIQDGDSVRLEVEDNGPGIPAEEQERVLQPFARILGNPSTGSGLGLAIACEIAHQHRAALQLLPGASGPGTLVRVTFAQRSG